MGELPGFQWQDYPYVYGVYVAVVPFITLALHRCSVAVQKSLQPHLSQLLKADQTADQRTRFVYRCWKLIEVFLLVLLGFCVLKNEPFTPPSLGGAGNVLKLFDYENGLDAEPASSTLAAYHIIRFAYLMEGWVFMDKFNYPYLTMHHAATFCAIMLSHRLSGLGYGALIIFAHDIPNIFTQGLVLLTAVRSGPLGILPLVACYLAALVTWSYYMLYVYPYEILYLPHTPHPGHFEMTGWQGTWFFGSVLILHHLYVMAKLLAWIPRFVTDPKGSAESAGRDKGH